MSLEEGLLRRALEGDHEGRARVAGAHEEEVDPPPLPRELELGLAPVDLGLHSRLVHLRHEGRVDRIPQLAPPAAHVLAHRDLGQLGVMLVDEPLPDPARRVALLARRRAVGDEPLVDQRPIRPELRRCPALGRLARRRQRRGERLAHGATVHPVTQRQRADRQALAVALSTDLLEELHP